jgi:hypothetical protein
MKNRSLTEFPRAKETLGSRRQWMHEATRKKDGAMLFTNVVYRGCVKGEWEACLVYPDESIERLERVPPIRLGSPTWDFTDYGATLRREGRD